MINYQNRRGILISTHIADLHFAAMNPKRQYDILSDQLINKLKDIPRLDLICVNGDLFDHKIGLSSDATMYASLFISEIVELSKSKNATVIILQGTLSHDANQLRIYYPYMQRNDVDVRIITNIRFETVKGCRILCIPELYGISEEYYQSILFGSGFYDLCIMHGTITGAVYGDNVGQSRLFRIEDFMNCNGPIISGHVHKADVFNDHFYYCGSPYRWRFDDDCFKGFILMSYNMDTRKYYLDYKEIFSDVYKTITMDQLVNNNPIDTIDYINHLKTSQHIDYIKIKFNTILPGSARLSLNDKFRNDNSVSFDFLSPEQEIAKKVENQLIHDNEQLSFLLTDQLTDEQKFVMWVNHLKNDDKFLTVEELQSILMGE